MQMLHPTCLARSRARLAYCLDSAVSWLDIWLMPAGCTMQHICTGAGRDPYHNSPVHLMPDGCCWNRIIVKFN